MPVTNPYGTSTCRPRFASGCMSVINNSRKQSTKRPTAPSPIVLPSQSTIALTVVWLPTMNASFARFASSSGKGRCETFFTPLKSLLPRFNSYAALDTHLQLTLSAICSVDGLVYTRSTTMFIDETICCATQRAGNTRGCLSLVRNFSEIKAPQSFMRKMVSKFMVSHHTKAFLKHGLAQQAMVC